MQGRVIVHGSNGGGFIALDVSDGRGNVHFNGHVVEGEIGLESHVEFKISPVSHGKNREALWVRPSPVVCELGEVLKINKHNNGRWFTFVHLRSGGENVYLSDRVVPPDLILRENDTVMVHFALDDPRRRATKAELVQ